MSQLEARERGSAFFTPQAEPAKPSDERAFAAPLNEKPGDRIGRYRLRQQIGHGGCGVVYMAEQEEPVRRKVALKVIKLGMDTRQVVARFEAERQVLALMDHPNIAKVLDAGATDTGRPYFVMELVGGIKITDYCDHHQLTTKQRLDLVIQVCRAIQHAHQKGIIHRDIKPSNVLVATQDGGPVPKVIDFGIAKATQGRLTDQTLFTAFEQFIGTPAYMSPEQAQLGGLDVDTRSDIYSLGVLLYELLTGKTPFDSNELLSGGLEGMRRTIQEKEPPTPSTRLRQELVAADVRLKSSATQQAEAGDENGASSRRLLQLKQQIHLLRGDLDWIVMKCLEKDRARRYETANGLAGDVERYLNNEPVVAGPPNRLYWFQKFVRRNKLLFVATSGVVLALVVGLGIALWQSVEKARAYSRAFAAKQEAIAAQASAEASRKKAETEASRSEQVAKFLQAMLRSVGPSVASGRDTGMLRDILDQAAERVGRELADEPEVEAELRDTIGFTYWELGEHEKAEQMYRRNLELLRKLGGSKSAAVAHTLHKLADVLRRTGNKLREAEANEREALGIYETLHGREHLTVGDSLHNLAGILESEGKESDAEAAARESLAIDIKLSDAEHPNVGVCLGMLGIVLIKRGELAEADTVTQDSVAIMRKASARRQSSWSGLNPSVELAHGLSVRAALLEHKGRWAESELLHREAKALLEEVLGADHPDVLGMESRLANALAAQGKLTEAESMLRERIAHLKSREIRPTLPAMQVRLAQILQHHGKLAEAEEVWREALAAQERIYGSEHRLVANSLQALASVLGSRGQWAEAEPLYRDSLKIAEKAAPDDWQTFNTRSLLGACLETLGKRAEAEPLLVAGYEGLTLREGTVPDYVQLPRLRETLQCLVHLCENTSRPDQAADWKRKLQQFNQSHASFDNTTNLVRPWL